MRKQSLDFLKALLTTDSVSGFEPKAQKLFLDYVKPFADKIETDAYGNARAILNPGGSTTVMLDGHIDELGMIVNYIDDKGFITVQRIGGIDAAQMPARRVNIHTAKGVIRGVVGAMAVHLQDREKAKTPPKMHEVFVDIGAKDGKAAKAKVAIGDLVTFVDDMFELDKNILAARALDNRIGVWVAAEVLRMASKKKGTLNACIVAASSIQEETGCNGAQMQVAAVKPDVAIAIDVTHATDTPGIDVKLHGEVKLGHGPTYTIGRENHPVLIERLKKVAAKNKIPTQVETFSLTGGTDAQAMWTKNGGTPACIISPPCRYMHSTVETMDLRDLQLTADWLTAFCCDLKKNEKFKVKI